MSSFEINKIVGAVLLVSLVSMVIGMVGDGLVTPRQHEAIAVAGGGAAAPAGAPAQKEPEKMEPIAPLLAEASAEQGEKSARKCATCHTFKKGEKAKLGPNLWDIVGMDKGAEEGFAYSSAMQSAEGNWTYEDLNHFIADPKGFVRGTKMVFAGVKKESERADIIAYLRSLSDQPKPLPEPAAAGDAGKEGAPAPEGGEAGAQPAQNPGQQPAGQGGAAPGGQPGAESGGQPDAQGGGQPHAQRGGQPDAQGGGQPGSQ